MRQRYPSLINLERQFPNNGSCRIGLIELPSPEKRLSEFHSPQELRDHLNKPESAAAIPWCRVYVLENLNLEYITVLGRHFDVDPTIFARQYRKMTWEAKPDENNTPQLLLCGDPDLSFTLRYSELRQFDRSIAGTKLTDSRTGRILTSPNKAKDFELFHTVGIVRCCISFWCAESSNKACWNGTPFCVLRHLIIQALILVDPQVQVGRGFHHGPYQYGYVDFTPWPHASRHTERNQSSLGPRRTCAYDDICYYLSHLPPDPQESLPQIPALVVKQLALSHTVALTEFLKAQISTIEDSVRRTYHGPANYEWLGGILNELFGWHRRLSEYCEHTEAALDRLRISHDGEIDNKGNEDFRWVHRRMVNLKKRNYELITFANGLVGLVQAIKSVHAAEESEEATKESRNASKEAMEESTKATLASQKAADASAKAAKASLMETRAVRALTIVGMLYLPLGFTSSLFSKGYLRPTL